MFRKLLSIKLALLLIFMLCIMVSQANNDENSSDYSMYQITQIYAASPAGGTIMIKPGVVLIDSKSVIEIQGRGFPPGKEITLRTLLGVPGILEGQLSDISYILEDKNIINDDGTFSITWTLDRAARNLIPGIVPLWVIVKDTEVVIPIIFYSNK